jgi:hypothetical protein
VQQRKCLAVFQFGNFLPSEMFLYGTGCAYLANSMSKKSKSCSWRGRGLACHSYRDYLIRSLGTPEGLRAFSEGIRDIATALNSLLMTTFVLFSKCSPGETILRITIFLALSKIVIGQECRGCRRNH